MTNRENIDTWARAAVVLIGVVAIVRGVEMLDPVVHILSLFAKEPEQIPELFWALVATVVAPGVLFYCGYLLIRYCQTISARLCNTAGKPGPYWEYAAYRLGFMLCGILVISWALPRLGQVCHNLAIRGDLVGEHREYLRQSAWVMLLWAFIQCAIGVYLIIGSPHIIKWQMKRGESGIVSDTPEAPEESTES
ncbi:MAG: hypothetical protein ACYST6_12390 [Planctomycetota bacterium]|jgi:hypothetical protein